MHSNASMRCGSGYGPVARGETVSQECTVAAKTMKYTNN